MLAVVARVCVCLHDGMCVLVVAVEQSPTWTLDGQTALILAAENGHADCVRVLLDAGADKKAKCNGWVRSSLVFVALEFQIYSRVDMYSWYS